jgi:hypothetical protein
MLNQGLDWRAINKRKSNFSISYIENGDAEQKAKWTTWICYSTPKIENYVTKSQQTSSLTTNYRWLMSQLNKAVEEQIPKRHNTKATLVIYP